MMNTNILLARDNHKAHLTARGPQYAGEPTKHFMNLTVSATLILIKSFSIPGFKEHCVQIYHYINGETETSPISDVHGLINSKT